MSSIAEVRNGQFVDSVNSGAKEVERANSSLDKDAFLQLLVAQMKYQDPLEPTSNTEYISQLATFSSLEEMQNLNSGMTLQRASQLVGQYVFMKVTDSSGNTTYPEGYVDYVVYENNKAYLSIGETLYSIDDLDTVADPTYMQATENAAAFIEKLNNLPNSKYITRADGADLGELILMYESMSSYEKSFISEDNLKLYADYLTAYKTNIVEPVSNFISRLEELPSAEELTGEHLEEMESLMGTYDDFTSYMKGLISDDAAKLYEAMEAKYQILKAEADTETDTEADQDTATE